ncbi:citrate synthase family protein [Caballeronia arationis]|nr:citrate synthase family protein [Caballeronia arationis]
MIEIINVKNWMTQEEACEALGVRQQTLYAYVSRGQIEVRGDPAHSNRKLYREADIAALLSKRKLGRARKSIAASTMAWGEPIVSTRISTVVRGRLYFRGADAIQLSDHATLEAVAQLLLDSATLPQFPSFPAVHGIDASQARAYAAIGHAAAEGKSAQGLPVADMCQEAAALIGRLASGLIDLPAGAEPLHLRIARAWNAEGHADLLRRALVMLADQELTSSAFAARVTASTGASLGACMLSGLATLSGVLHGNANVRVRALFDDVKQSGIETAVQRWMSSGAPLPGFGHPLYPQGDPRAQALLQAFEPSEQSRTLIAHVESLTGLKPAIDVALACLADYCKLPDGAAYSLFAIGRSVGWMAHAIEQFLSGSLLRPRAHYIGPAIDEIKDVER